jgi:1,4-dihydroxy-2-naphthoate polyprenyltransferase
VSVVEPSRTALFNPLQRYFLATRPAFLAASAVPVLIGVALARYSGFAIDPLLALFTLLGAVVIHAGVNVLNDYYDDLNGTDALNQERLFPFTGGSRFIQNGVLTREQTALFGAALLGCGAMIGLWLSLHAGYGLIVIGLVGLFIGWAYSAPPFALNSHGFGEASIAVGFGLLIVTGADFVQRHHFDSLPLFASLPYALLATALLYLNQFPDRVADEQAGKRHWVVRLGVARARWGYLLLVTAAYGTLLALVVGTVLPAWALLGLLPLPISLSAAHGLLKNAQTVAKLVPAIVQTIQALVAHGALLAVGLWLAA